MTCGSFLLVAWLVLDISKIEFSWLLLLSRRNHLRCTYIERKKFGE